MEGNFVVKYLFELKNTWDTLGTPFVVTHSIIFMVSVSYENIVSQDFFPITGLRDPVSRNSFTRMQKISSH